MILPKSETNQSVYPWSPYFYLIKLTTIALLKISYYLSALKHTRK